jgi:hypothetical protein
VDRASRRFIAVIVAAQVLTQIGTFILPALLPEYIDRWDLSKTEAGWPHRHLLRGLRRGRACAGGSDRSRPRWVSA